MHLDFFSRFTQIVNVVLEMPTSIPYSTYKEGTKRMDLCSIPGCGRRRASGHMLKQEEFGQGIRKNFFTLKTSKQHCAVFVLGEV